MPTTRPSRLATALVLRPIPEATADYEISQFHPRASRGTGIRNAGPWSVFAHNDGTASVNLPRDPTFIAAPTLLSAVQTPPSSPVSKASNLTPPPSPDSSGKT